MRHPRRSGFSLFELLVILALLGLLMALLLPAVAKVRSAANRTKSANHLKQVGIALHGYHDTYGSLPPGNDDKNFSAAAKVLPFIEQDNLFKLIDFTKPSNDEANEKVRATTVVVYLSPNDPFDKVSDKSGATNYLFCAGSKYDVAGNNGMLFQNSKIRFALVTDGTSNTIMTGETLKGDGGTAPPDVRRQYVLLKKEALGDLNDDSGVKDFADGKNTAGDRCAAWIDGRFLQGTFTGTRVMNDKKPDVSCEGTGGLSGLRTLTSVVNVGFGDGSVRALDQKIDLNTWKALTSRDGNEVIAPF